MKPILALALLALLSLSAAVEPARAAATPHSATTTEPEAEAGGVEGAALTGTWMGALAVQGIELRLMFHLTLSDEGELEATLDSPDQGANAIPVESVSVDGHTIRFDVTAIGAVYEGELDAELSAIAGEWRQSNRALPLEVSRQADE